MTSHDDELRSDVPELADAELVLRTRSGDSKAFGELWRRHYRSGLTVAQSVTSSLDPDAEADRPDRSARTCSRASATRPPDGAAHGARRRSTSSTPSKIRMPARTRPTRRSIAA
jgi:hypothetical protein